MACMLYETAKSTHAKCKHRNLNEPLTQCRHKLASLQWTVQGVVIDSIKTRLLQVGYFQEREHSNKRVATIRLLNLFQLGLRNLYRSCTM